jgi:hypothetical protein
VTFCAVPKPFQGHVGIIQRNAVRSWLSLEPRPEIVLLGDDAGVAELCEEFGLRHVPCLQRNEFGTPLLDDIFTQMQQTAETETLLYVNADIILFNDMLRAITLVADKLPDFLLAGRRWDYDLTEPLAITATDWQAELRADVARHARQANPASIDYFAFRPGLWPRIPPFALGRFMWDTWLLDNALENQRQVVDCSEFVTAVHQNHDYTHIPGVKAEKTATEMFFADVAASTTGYVIERNRNLALCGKWRYGVGTMHAPLFLDKAGELHIRSRPAPR